MEQFFTWSERNLGQSHYVLGYLIILISHNWPILLAIGVVLIVGIRLYRQPTRARVVWLFSALAFGLRYEYEKHIAGELHRAINMLFILELATWNQPLHIIVGPVMNASFLLITVALVIHGLYLSFQSSVMSFVRRYYPARTHDYSSGATAPSEEENHERAGNNINSTQTSPWR